MSDDELVYASPYLDKSGCAHFRISRFRSRGLFWLSYSNGMQFWLDQEGNHIWANWPGGSSLEDAATYLLGPVLGILLRLRGTVCLHASAVALEDRCIALVGPPGAGKSTTAAILGQRGWSIVSDDIVPLTRVKGVFRVPSAYPFLCLCPDSVAMLYGSADSLPSFVPQWEKRCLAADGEGNRKIKFEPLELPLAAIYLFEPRTSNPISYVAPISQRAAFMSLVANSYATRVLDRHKRAEEFEVFGQVVSSLPIRGLHVSQGMIGFDQVHEIICTNLGWPTHV